MIYWWVYYCFLKWNIVNRRLGSLPLLENGVLPIHVPEHSHSHLLNGDADQNKGTSRLKRSLAIEEGMAGISYPVILYFVALTRCWDPPYCLHFISHGLQLPKNSHSLVRCPSMSRWLDFRVALGAHPNCLQDRLVSALGRLPSTLGKENQGFHDWSPRSTSDCTALVDFSSTKLLFMDFAG